MPATSAFIRSEYVATEHPRIQNSFSQDQEQDHEVRPSLVETSQFSSLFLRTG